MTAKLNPRNSPSVNGIKRLDTAIDSSKLQPTTSTAETLNIKKNGNDHSPSLSTKYGYAEAAPDDKSKDGYGDDDTSANSLASSTTRTTQQPLRRRSSMKQAAAPPRRRRASIQMGEEIERHILGRVEPVQRRSSVTFNGSVRVKPVVPVQEMIAPECGRDTLWFQDEEYDRMKQKNWKIVDEEVESRLRGETPPATEYCIRGLERMMNFDEVKQIKNRCVDAVLGEQHLQREQDIFDEDFMASLYKFRTASSQKEAELRGKQDEADIQNYMTPTRKYVRRMTMT